MTKQLILLRHAKSDWDSLATSDHARSLHKRGRKDAPKVARWMAENIKQPQLVLCSTALRTRQTWQLIQSNAGWDRCQTAFSDDLYMATLDRLLQQIKQAFEKVDQLLIIAHNPGLDLCLLHYCPAVKLTHDHKLMTTAAFAVLEFDDDDSVIPRLVDFKRPAEL